MASPSLPAFGAVPGIAWPGAIWPGNASAEEPVPEYVIFSAGDARWAWTVGAARNT